MPFIVETTLEILKNRNTSAAASRSGSPAGKGHNASAANIAKNTPYGVNVRDLMPAMGTARPMIWSWHQAWFGTAAHINVGYDNNSQAQADAIAQDVLERGCDGILVNWFGRGTQKPGDWDRVNAAHLKLLESCRQRGLKFALFWDAQVLGPIPASSRQQWLKDEFTYADAHFFNNSAYYKSDGRPWFGFFGDEAFAGDLDWSDIRKHVKGLSQGNPILLFRNVGGLDRGNPNISDAAYAWVDPHASDASTGGGVNYLRDFYGRGKKQIAANGGHQFLIGSAYKGFDDSQAAWSQKRYIDQRNGQTWLDTWAAISGYFGPGNPLQHVMLVTWDDYEEGTELETGIDAGLAISQSLQGNTLSWTLTGNANCVAKFMIWATLDGKNVGKLADNVPAAARTYDLKRVTDTLPPGRYQVYVQAVGKAYIQCAVAPEPATLQVAEPAKAVPIEIAGSIPGPDYRGNLSATSKWMATVQLADGAIQYSDEKINPYFSNYAALGWLHDPSRYEQVRKYMEWYIAHLEAADRWGINTGGVIYDFTIVNHATGKPSTSPDTGAYQADSVDSYAATFLTLAYNAFKTGDASLQAFIKNSKTPLDKIAAVLTSPRVMNPDGLTWALPDYQAKYLMDNCEVYRGFADYAALCDFAFHDSAGQSRYEAAAEKCKQGILTLWTGSAWVTQKGAAAPNLSTWYPDAIAQVFPVLCGVLPPDDARVVISWRNFNNAWPDWPQLSYQPADDFPWVLAGHAAACKGDYARVNQFIASLESRYQSKGFPWTWYCMEAGWYMLMNSNMLRAQELLPEELPARPQQQAERTRKKSA
jgi:hypothetical protein